MARHEITFNLRALLQYLKLPRVASHCLHKILIIILKGMLVISRAYHYSPRPLPDPRPTPSSRLALALGIARRPVPARAVAFTKAATAALARRRAGLPSPALPCSYPSDRCPALYLPLAAAGASSRRRPSRAAAPAPSARAAVVASVAAFVESAGFPRALAALQSEASLEVPTPL